MITTQTLNKKNNDITDRLLLTLIFVSVFVNAFGLLFSVSGGDSSVYCVIAQHMILHHDWINLVYHNKPWLDKPHFPFWISAFSYKIFGINAFAYIFPGFLFNLIGALYTYLLAKKLYSHEMGLLATLIYLSSLNLLMSSIDVEAEAYLLGQIIPACYYWLIYNADNTKTIKIRYLLLGAFFTALAMMTKGVFVLLPIFSGLGIIWLYQLGLLKTLRILFSVKWLLALSLPFILIAPELIALYLQFDQHPNLVIFGHTHVSGIKFYFWDSQFGRFFNTGPITKNLYPHQIDLSHYFYYMHVMLWAFLPWCFLFLLALVSMKRRSHFTENTLINKIYLLGSFFPTFVIFSLTRFQFDHYVNIIFPFAAIIVAECIFDAIQYDMNYKFICRLQNSICLILCAIAIIFSLAALPAWPVDTFNVYQIFKYKVLYGAIAVAALITFFYTLLKFNDNKMRSSLISSLVSIFIAFIFLMNTNETFYRIYAQGYQENLYLENKPAHPIISYQLKTDKLEFRTQNLFVNVKSPDQLVKITQQQMPYYLVTTEKNWGEAQSVITLAYQNNHQTAPTMRVLKKIRYVHASTFPQTLSILVNEKKRKALVETAVIALVSLPSQ